MAGKKRAQTVADPPKTLVPEILEAIAMYAREVPNMTQPLGFPTAVRLFSALFTALLKARGGFAKLADDAQCLPYDRSVLYFLRRPEGMARGFTPLSLDEVFAEFGQVSSNVVAETVEPAIDEETVEAAQGDE